MVCNKRTFEMCLADISGASVAAAGPIHTIARRRRRDRFPSAAPNKMRLEEIVEDVDCEGSGVRAQNSLDYVTY